MRPYLLGRVLSSLFTLFAFLTILFVVGQILLPNDFTSNFILTGEQREAMRRQLGLDRPLWARYLMWMGGVLRGDLGTSFWGDPVWGRLRGVLPYSVVAFTAAMGGAYLFGSWLGRLAGWHREGWASGVATGASVTLYASFPPWLVLVLTRLVLAVGGFGLLAVLRRSDEAVWAGGPSPTAVLWWVMATVVVVLALRPFLVRGYEALTWRSWRRSWSAPAVGSILAGSWWALGVGRQVLDLALVMFLTILVLFLLAFGEVQVLMQTAVSGARREDYVVTARAKGLSERDVRDRHAGRAGLLPVLSKVVVSLPYYLAGLVIVEQSLDVPGLGSTLFGALEARDTPVVMGALLIIGLVTMGARLGLDVLYAVLDPRIRYGGPS